MTRFKLMGAAAVLASCLTAVPASTAQAAGITGAGSTLIAPLIQQKWAPDYQHRFGTSVTYGAVGSGTGITDISNPPSVDFGASDAPLTPAQAAKCSGCMEIPWALTATAIAYRLDGVSKTVHLSGPVLANIYLGSVTHWNDPQIKKLNKGVTLPNTAITPVYRSDGSGDTYAFTDFLSRVSSAAKASLGVATKVNFTHGVGGAKNDGVTAVVSSTNGSVGYISASYVIAHHLKTAALQNAAGKFVLPNLSNIEAAAKSLKSVPANRELHIVNPPKKFPTAFPLSTFTYAIVRKDRNPKPVASFVYYAITTGQGFGAPLDFAPLPKAVKQADTKAVKALQS